MEAGVKKKSSASDLAETEGRLRNVLASWQCLYHVAYHRASPDAIGVERPRREHQETMLLESGVNIAKMNHKDCRSLTKEVYSLAVAIARDNTSDTVCKRPVACQAEESPFA